VARCRARAVFGWAWFFLALLPNANIRSPFNLMNDRFVYLAMLGLLVVLVEAVQGLRAWRRGEDASPEPARLVPMAACGYLVLLWLLAAAQSAYWASDELIFRQAVERQPRSGFAHLYYASELERLADAAADPAAQTALLASARQHFQQALASGDIERYFDPLGLRVRAARLSLQLRRPGEALANLEGWLTPAEPTEAAFSGTDSGNLPPGSRRGVFNGTSAVFSETDLGRARLLYARAWLLVQAEAPERMEDAALDEAARWTALALEISTEPKGPWLFKAALRGLRFIQKPFPDLKAEGWHGPPLPDWTATDAKDLVPALDAHHERLRADPAWRALLGPEAGLERETAVAWGLLAEASLHQATQLSPEEASAHLAWRALGCAWLAKRAHPAWSEPHLLAARAHLMLDRTAVGRTATAEAWEHFTWAQAILRSAPQTQDSVHRIADLLSSLQPPPGPKPPELTLDLPELWMKP
jgi:hypothetical protein